MQVIFLCPRTGQQLAMPVTPPGWELERGRLVERVELAQVSQLHVPGLQMLFQEKVEFLLPAGPRNYTQGGYDGSGRKAMLDTLVGWSRAGEVVRYLITETDINEAVLLGPVTVRESGGAGDLTVSFTLYQYRARETSTVPRPETGNRPRPDEDKGGKLSTYTVQKGDNLWNICRRTYGQGALSTQVAAYNSIKNPNLIFPGQKIRLPPRDQL